jgi:hypothetical protein
VSLSRLFACALTLAVLSVPGPGLDCFAPAQDPLPCCEHPGSQQMGEAPACCQNAPLSSNRSVVAAASPSPRHHDGFVAVPGPLTALAPPAFVTDVVAFASSSALPPPRRPAVLRL